jgi:hypothetical protein
MAGRDACVNSIYTFGFLNTVSMEVTFDEWYYVLH